MIVRQATAFESEYFFKKVTNMKGMKVDRLCVRRVLKGTSWAKCAHHALPASDGSSEVTRDPRRGSLTMV